MTDPRAQRTAEALDWLAEVVVDPASDLPAPAFGGGEVVRALCERVRVATHERALASGAPPRDADVSAWLHGLEAARGAQISAAEVVEECARQAYAAGASWTAIGARLGVTRQAAQQRFGSGSVE